MANGALELVEISKRCVYAYNLLVTTSLASSIYM